MVNRKEESFGVVLFGVALGIAVETILQISVLVQGFLPAFLDGTWQRVTTPGTDAYSPFWSVLMIEGLLVGLALIGAGIALLVLFFRRSRKFPRIFIAVALWSFVAAAGEAWLGERLLESLGAPESAGGEYVERVRRTLAVVLVGVPYMLFSKRVKSTFIR